MITTIVISKDGKQAQVFTKTRNRVWSGQWAQEIECAVQGWTRYYLPKHVMYVHPTKVDVRALEYPDHVNVYYFDKYYSGVSHHSLERLKKHFKLIRRGMIWESR